MRFLVRVRVYSEDTQGGLGRWKGRAIFYSCTVKCGSQSSSDRCLILVCSVPDTLLDSWLLFQAEGAGCGLPDLDPGLFIKDTLSTLNASLLEDKISQIILTVRGTRGELQKGNLGSLDR